MKCDQPAIKELPERQVACVSFTGDYMGNPQVFADLFCRLCGWAGPKGLLSASSVFMSSYYDDPNVTPPNELRLDICLGIPEDTQVAGDVKKTRLPGGTYAVMHAELDGPQEYGPAWNAVVEWIAANDYEIDMSRPSHEIYLNNPEEHPEKHHLLDICMSVKRKP